MNKKEIEELIKFVSKSGVSEVSLEIKDLKLTIKNSAAVVKEVIVSAPVVAPQLPVMQQVAAPVQPVAPAPQKSEIPAAPSEDSKYVQIKSPMVGTFYRASSPEKPNFTNPGEEIKPGQVICIIEAMKLFNEIESEISGRIVKVLVDNASPVEYDQPLFLVDPS